MQISQFLWIAMKLLVLYLLFEHFCRELELPKSVGMVQHTLQYPHASHTHCWAVSEALGCASALNNPTWVSDAIAVEVPCKKILSSSQHKNNNLLLNEDASEHGSLAELQVTEDLIAAPVAAWASNNHLCGGERQCCVSCFQAVSHHVRQHTLMWPDAVGSKICAKLLNRRRLFEHAEHCCHVGHVSKSFCQPTKDCLYVWVFSTKKEKQLAITTMALEIITSPYGVSCPNASIYGFVWKP